MKKVFVTLGALVLVASLGWLVYYFMNQSSASDKAVKTEQLTKGNVYKKTVSTGSINPKREVAIKPQISGILDELYVEPGQKVSKGQLIARIKIIPNMASLSNSESSLRRAMISKENARKEFARQEQLFKDGVISSQEYASQKLSYDLAVEAVTTAEENLRIVREGATRDAGTSTTLVRATVDGMVLETPLKEGSQVIESNNFNEGSTLAIIADMGEMIFQGKIDESEVGKLHKGMPLKLKVGAMDGVVFDAYLDHIAPKGKLEEGAIKFEIKANVKLREDVFLRAGYSANAEIILDKREQVFVVKESNLQFSGDTVYAQVLTAPDKFDKRRIRTGLSDGILVEVLSGLTPSDKIKAL